MNSWVRASVQRDEIDTSGYTASLRAFYVSIIVLDVLIIVINLVVNRGLDPLASFEGVFVRQFDLDGEANFASWYSSFLYCVTGFMALVHARGIMRPRFLSLGWYAMGLGLVVLSIEEVAQVHEMVGIVYGSHSELADSVADPVFVWLYIYIVPIAGFLAVASFCFITSFRRPLASLVTAFGGLVCWGGVLVFEYLESQIDITMVARPLYQMVLEEGLELAGATCLIIALIEHHIFWRKMGEQAGSRTELDLVNSPG